MDGAHDGCSRLHQLGTASLPSWGAAKPLKIPPTSCAVRTRPVKPPGKVFCRVDDFVPDPAAVDPLGLLVARRHRGCARAVDG